MVGPTRMLASGRDRYLTDPAIMERLGLFIRDLDRVPDRGSEAAVALACSSLPPSPPPRRESGLSRKHPPDQDGVPKLGPTSTRYTSTRW